MQATRISVGYESRVTITDLYPGATYEFYVTAYNTAGLESDPSETITYTVPLPGEFRVASVRKNATGGFIISANGTADSLYELQATSEIAAPSSWETVGFAVSGPTGLVTIVDEAEHAIRFYRLIRIY